MKFIFCINLEDIIIDMTKCVYQFFLNNFKIFIFILYNFLEFYFNISKIFINFYVVKILIDISIKWKYQYKHLTYKIPHQSIVFAEAQNKSGGISG